MRTLLLSLWACAPTQPVVEGTQAGDEGDEDLCLHETAVVDDLDAHHGTVPMTPAEFLAVVQTPVSGPIDLPGGPETLSLAMTVTGDVVHHFDSPGPRAEPGSCTSQSFTVPVTTHLQAGSQLDITFTDDAWGFQAGHAFTGVEMPLQDVVGTLAPQVLDPDAYDTVVLRAFGGSTDGVWSFNMDWRADGPGTASEEEDIARVELLQE
ncbi:MAG: hypothetical protein H6734_15675 [Alphaproteobacteria bacterium]|nr:hypothetical protein [Alphaproteobacteria bacterium]